VAPRAPPPPRGLWGAREACEPLHAARVVRDSAIRSERPLDEVLRLPGDEAGPGPLLPVYPLGRDYPEYEDAFLVAITETRSVEDVEWLAHMLEHGQAGWDEHIHDHDEAGNPVANGAVR